MAAPPLVPPGTMVHPEPKPIPKVTKGVSDHGALLKNAANCAPTLGGSTVSQAATPAVGLVVGSNTNTVPPTVLASTKPAAAMPMPPWLDGRDHTFV